MNTRKPAMLLAAAAASVALAVGLATPANAARESYHYGGRTLGCPSTMHAYVSFSTSYAGQIRFTATNLSQQKGFDFGTATKSRLLSYTSPIAGSQFWEVVVWAPVDPKVTFYTTCVR